MHKDDTTTTTAKTLKTKQMMIPKRCTEQWVLRMVIGDSGARGWKRGGGGWDWLAVDYCKAFGHETGIRFDELSLKCVSCCHRISIEKQMVEIWIGTMYTSNCGK